MSRLQKPTQSMPENFLVIIDSAQFKVTKTDWFFGFDIHQYNQTRKSVEMNSNFYIAIVVPIQSPRDVSFQKKQLAFIGKQRCPFPKECLGENTTKLAKIFDIDINHVQFVFVEECHFNNPGIMISAAASAFHLQHFTPVVIALDSKKGPLFESYLQKPLYPNKNTFLPAKIDHATSDAKPISTISSNEPIALPCAI